MTPLIGSLVLFWMIDSQGVIGAALQAAFNDPQLSLKASPTLTWLMLFVYGVWHGAPFSFIVFYAGLQTVPEDTLESAIVDGASRWERIRYVVIPYLMPLVTFVALILLMDNFRVFEPIVGFSAQASATSLSWLVYNDLRYRRVPNALVVSGFALQLLWLLAAWLAPGWAYPPRWSGWLMAWLGFAAALPFLLLWSRRLMGAGDVKAIAVLGLLLGLPALLAVLVLSSLLAGLHALLSGAAFMIVVVGTVAAIFIQTPLAVFKHAMSRFSWVLKPPPLEGEALIKKIVEWSNIARKQGLLGLSVPEQYGGPGESDYRFRVVIQSEIARVGASALQSGFSTNDDIVLNYLLRHANDEQKQRWLPGFVTGETIGAIAMSEPAAGSDLRGITTSAVADGPAAGHLTAPWVPGMKAKTRSASAPKRSSHGTA